MSSAVTVPGTRHFVLLAESPLRGDTYSQYAFCHLPLIPSELSYLLHLRERLFRDHPRVLELVLRGGPADWYDPGALPSGATWDDGVLRYRYLELPAAELAYLAPLDPDSAGEGSELVLTNRGLAVQHLHSDILDCPPVRTFMVPWRVLRSAAGRRKSELP